MRVLLVRRAGDLRNDGARSVDGLVGGMVLCFCCCCMQRVWIDDQCVTSMLLSPSVLVWLRDK
jgi:hypothetical protein